MSYAFFNGFEIGVGQKEIVASRCTLIRQILGSDVSDLDYRQRLVSNTMYHHCNRVTSFIFHLIGEGMFITFSGNISLTVHLLLEIDIYLSLC